MPDVQMIDATGQPRPVRDILSALSCIESEMVKNPIGMSKDGQPLLMHYLVIRDALRELLHVRELLARASK